MIMNNKPIRVLQYIGSLNIGGSQSMIMEMYRKIDKSKIQFDFIIDRNNETFYEEEILNMGGKVYKLDYYFKGWNYYQFKKEWKKFFNEHKEYKIIHCHVRSVAAIVLKIAKKFEITTICHSHSTSNGHGIKSYIKRKLQKKIIKYADYLFACSEDSAKWLYGEHSLESKKCMIINNAIDTNKYIYDELVRNKKRTEFRINNKIVLGQVGRIEEVKNYFFTIELLKELININNNYYLIIVGTGSLKKQLLNQINKYNLNDNVLLLENRNDVNELMQAMDIFIMPSLWEGLPLSLIEAQAADLPCVISNNISAGLLDKRLIRKLSLDDLNSWIACIEEEKNHDRTNNKKIILDSGFDIDSNVKKLTFFYEEVMEKNET